MSRFVLLGEAPGLADLLTGAGLAPSPPAEAALALCPDVAARGDVALTDAEAWLAAPGPPGLLVLIAEAARLPAGWEGVRRAATLAAFLAYAARHYAARDRRVNALALGDLPGPAFVMHNRAPAQPATKEGVAATILGMLRWRAMTGQIIRLAA